LVASLWTVFMSRLIPTLVDSARFNRTFPFSLAQRVSDYLPSQVMNQIGAYLNRVVPRYNFSFISATAFALFRASALESLTRTTWLIRFASVLSVLATCYGSSDERRLSSFRSISSRRLTIADSCC